MAIILPHDVLFHRILPRLPIKSVLHLKCVSKEFNSFLSSNVFKKMHIRHIDYHQKHDKFIALPHDLREPRVLSTIDCEAPADKVLTRTSFKLPAMASSKGTIKFLTSFHGLVCLYIPIKNGYEHYDLILWNPVTSEYKRLPKPNSRVDRNNIRIFKPELCVMCCLHILVESKLMEKGCCPSDKKYSVIKFDTKTERFTELKTTSGFNNVQNKFRATLMVKKGCIHVCIVYDVGKTGFETELWKITEEGDWKKMESYSVDPGNMYNMKPLHMRRNGNLLMLGYKYLVGTYNCEGFLYNVDMKKKHSKGKGKDNETLCGDMDTEISQIVRYTETLVSPNQYIE